MQIHLHLTRLIKFSRSIIAGGGQRLGEGGTVIAPGRVLIHFDRDSLWTTVDAGAEWQRPRAAGPR